MVAILSLSPVSQSPSLSQSHSHSDPRLQTQTPDSETPRVSPPLVVPDSDPRPETPVSESQSLISFPLHSYGAISSATSPGRWRHLTCHVTLSLAPLTHGLLPPSLCPRSCLYKQQLPRSFPPSRNSPPITALLSLPLRPSSPPPTSTSPPSTSTSPSRTLFTYFLTSTRERSLPLPLPLPFSPCSRLGLPGRSEAPEHSSLGQSSGGRSLPSQLRVVLPGRPSHPELLCLWWPPPWVSLSG